MKFMDRLLTIIITATLTSAIWIVFGGTIIEAAEGGGNAPPTPTNSSLPSEKTARTR